MKKFLLYTLIILLILWGTFFIIDYNRCNNLSMPIFVLPENTVDDGGTGIYYGIGYKVYVKKHVSSEYGVNIESIEMYFFNKIVAASISDNY